MSSHDMTKALTHAEELRESLYKQLARPEQGTEPESGDVHDPYAGQELVREASLLSAMIKIAADTQALEEQIRTVIEKVLVAHTTSLLTESSADQACDMLRTIRREIKDVV